MLKNAPELYKLNGIDRQHNFYVFDISTNDWPAYRHNRKYHKFSLETVPVNHDDVLIYIKPFTNEIQSIFFHIKSGKFIVPLIKQVKKI